MGVRIGYEVELLSQMGVAAIRENIRQIGIEIPERYQGHYENWSIKGDGSLRGSGGRGGNGHEIVSPILPLEDGLTKMKEVFDWMTANNHYTNSSCGFHVGVSLDDARAMENLDELKLTLLFDANRVLRMFGRQNSTYSRPLKREMMNHIRRQAPYWNMAQQAAPGMYPNRNWRANLDDLEKIRLLIPREKFTSSNLTKLLADPPYIEFRCMGNENYHGRWEEVRDTVLYYAEMIQAACDPAERKEEYDLEVNRLLRMVGRVRTIETERHAEAVRVAAEREAARLAPLIERDNARRQNRAAVVPARRRQIQKMATEAAQQGIIALEELDQTLMTIRQIRNRIRAARTPVDAVQDEIAA